MRRAVLVAGAALLVATAACSSGTDDATVEVTLTEWAAEADPGSVDAGEITFDVANDGEEVHELVVIRSDEEPDALPTADDGSIDEDEVEVVGEVEDIAAGEDGEVTLDLEPGAYVLACNVVEEEDDGTVESHYEMGMHTALRAG